MAHMAVKAGKVEEVGSANFIWCYFHLKMSYWQPLKAHPHPVARTALTSWSASPWPLLRPQQADQPRAGPAAGARGRGRGCAQNAHKFFGCQLSFSLPLPLSPPLQSCSPFVFVARSSSPCPLHTCVHSNCLGLLPSIRLVSPIWFILFVLYDTRKYSPNGILIL